MPTKHAVRHLAQIALAFALTPLWIATPQRVFSAAAPVGATVSVLSLPVDVANTDHVGFTPAIDGQTLSEGDSVRTGPGGMALVTFFDGSESQLGGESQVQIEQVRANPSPQIAFLQTAGVTVSHVIPMPADGSFRTDTPAATGLVRGTSYVVIVGSVATCGPAGDQPCVTSMILLTDRNGHVGRVDVTANDSSAPAVQLASAGDAVAASGATTTPAHLDASTLAQLESVAHVRGDTNASLTTEQEARAIAATLVSQTPTPPVVSPLPVVPTPPVVPMPRVVSSPTADAAPVVGAPSAHAEDPKESTSVKSDKPASPAAPSTSSSPGKPSTSTTSHDSAKPSTSTTSSEPAKPSTSTTSHDSAKPSTSTTSSEPSKPSTSTTSSTSGSTSSGKSNDSGKSDTAAKSDDSGKSSDSGKSGKSAK